jgi:Ala-tRNA(Pro) deacylase
MSVREHKVKLAIDEDLLKEDMFGCHPCVNTSSLRFRTKDLINAVLPAMGAEPVYVKLTGER